MLKDPGRRLLLLTLKAPQRICIQCQIRLQHSASAESSPEIESFAEDTRTDSRQDVPRRSLRRPVQHPARQPRTYISRQDTRTLPKFEFMKASRSRPQFPDRLPPSRQAESPVERPAEVASKPPAPTLLEQDLNQVTQVLRTAYWI